MTDLRSSSPDFIIAAVPDFWSSGRVTVGHHNADRIIDALDAAGYLIVPKNPPQPVSSGEREP